MALVNTDNDGVVVAESRRPSSPSTSCCSSTRCTTLSSRPPLSQARDDGLTLSHRMDAPRSPSQAPRRRHGAHLAGNSGTWAVNSLARVVLLSGFTLSLHSICVHSSLRAVHPVLPLKVEQIDPRESNDSMRVGRHAAGDSHSSTCIVARAASRRSISNAGRQESGSAHTHDVRVGVEPESPRLTPSLWQPEGGPRRGPSHGSAPV